MGKLTRRQKDYIAVASRPDIKTFADVARALGTTRQSAHVILTRDDVAAVLERERSKRLDKTSSVVERLGRLAERITGELEGRDLSGLDESYLAGLLKTAYDGQEKAAKIAAGLSDADRQRAERIAAGRELLRGKLDQAVRIGRYLERRARRKSEQSCNPPDPPTT